MQPRPLSFALPALVLAAALLAGCTTPLERRERIAEIDVAWRDTIPDGSLEEMLEHLRALGKLPPGGAQGLAAVPVLCQQAVSLNTAALARAEALAAAWRLVAHVPSERLAPDSLSTSEVRARTDRFEQLLDEPGGRDTEEILQLAEFMGAYRFPPTRVQFAITIAEVVVSRALWDEPGPVQRVFAAHAPGSLRHAVTLVTLQATGDPYPAVRQEALRQAHHLHPDLALQVLAQGLTREEDTMLLFTALDSLAALGPRLPAAARDDVAELLGRMTQHQDVAVRRRATEVAAALT